MADNDSMVRGAKGVLFFVLRFLGVSMVLYLLYLWAGIYYMRLVAHGARPLLAAFGHTLDIERALSITEEISLNPIVFLSLVIAVTKIPVVAKIRAAVVGLLILTAANSITVFMSFLSFYRKSEQLWTGTEFFNLTINFFLPLLLWLILLPIKDLIFSTRQPTA
jgi:hypothetical protein